MGKKKLTNKTEYSYSKIRWKDEDYRKLHKASNILESQIKKHINEIPENARPRKSTYEELKSLVTSRRDLDIIVDTISKHAKNPKAFKTRKVGNAEVTNYEYDLLSKLDYRNKYKLNISYNKEVQKELQNAKPILDMYGEPVKDSMGNTLVKAQLPSSQRVKVGKYLEKSNLEMLNESRDVSRAHELIDRIYKRGFDTFEADKDKIYKENYLEMFKDHYENLDGFEEVYDKLNSISERDFLEYLKKIDSQGYNNFREVHYNNPMAQADLNNIAEKLDVAINQGLEYVSEDIV